MLDHTLSYLIPFKYNSAIVDNWKAGKGTERKKEWIERTRYKENGVTQFFQTYCIYEGNYIPIGCSFIINSFHKKMYH